ncbi:aspartate ammonia-lyase [Agrobacterium rhizogenes]|uniref:Aspartate ammonia-lyase n=1 Tax=Rhizobium rhizogenes NBRC 13257 TaxID=1220581 RepID=A0AA87Q347_RHIRH|nr:aspartate ammonia-lyase [Rhizobium rhizogenes]NTF58360.1 aspartate ammonia-lyase [Rhizobium rhizogenes]NTF77942.1 aspartate ammonia-lyase [Rhizobium rhizogenes]NTF96864.1 aspartate ammonia-lyase [Rhizobium rhizogenes]NTG03839.1 aspartate ammonia-lyase [Rhizobium rhizogenes]NTG10941.1 aspartate ammonia-lyase [Rhizobium rhizogenes]
MTRREHDLLGTKEIPADVYWGVHTARAVENFQVTGMTIGRNPYLVRGLTFVKEAAAIANHELGLLDQVRMDAIVRACREIRAGALHDQFVVDEIQGGAGTSTNMNANEVIANRALELLGHSKGDYAHLHPNDHVNLSQSTNDAYPTAINIALIEAIDDLAASMTVLKSAFDRKAQEFARFIKLGRTQLQDAVPMTLGQEFRTFVVMLGEDKARLIESAALLHEINLGATAIGTGLNAPRGYAALACEHLSRLTGRPLVTADDLIEATQDPGAFVHLSGVLKRVAVKLSKTCNDLRLLSSGPRAGIGEITLPAVQAGSSIMPGKINPVIPEMVNQVAYAVIGNDITITMAAEAGQLQLNAFEPIMVRALSQSISQLSAACRILAERCVDGIQPNPAIMAARVEESIGLATALNPLIGYYAATEVAQEALASGRTVPEVVLARGHLTVEQLQKALSPEHLANLPAIVIAEPDLLQ